MNTNTIELNILLLGHEMGLLDISDLEDTLGMELLDYLEDSYDVDNDDLTSLSIDGYRLGEVR